MKVQSVFSLIFNLFSELNETVTFYSDFGNTA